jgi:hypothetical protein
MSATWPEGGKIVSPTSGAHATTRFETDPFFLCHGMEAKGQQVLLTISALSSPVACV